VEAEVAGVEDGALSGVDEPARGPGDAVIDLEGRDLDVADAVLLPWGGHVDCSCDRFTLCLCVTLSALPGAELEAGTVDEVIVEAGLACPLYGGEEGVGAGGHV